MSSNAIPVGSFLGRSKDTGLDTSAYQRLVGGTRPDPRESVANRKPVRPSGKGPGAKIFAGLAVGALLIFLGSAGAQYLDHAGAHEETEDAYTAAHVHNVSSRINGTVLSVLVDDNQSVKKDEPLVTLDPADYQLRVDQALAALEVAQRQARVALVSINVAGSNANGKQTQAGAGMVASIATIARMKAGLGEARASIPKAQAELAQRQAEEDRAAADYKRYDVLARQGAVSLQQRDEAYAQYQVSRNATIAARRAVEESAFRAAEAEHAVAEAQAQLEHSRGQMQEARSFSNQTEQTKAQYEVAAAAITEARARLKDAQLQLSYTTIKAPVSGRVGKRTVEAGQHVQSGQTLLAVVGQEPWVVANFKETQLNRIRPGQDAEIVIDSFPGHKFRGKVDSISPGSGATFALIPPENATGNFTKIVQRVPVKITFDPASLRGYESLVVPGMSVIANVSTSR